jgi:hypothetical protein
MKNKKECIVATNMDWAVTESLYVTQSKFGGNRFKKTEFQNHHFVRQFRGKSVFCSQAEQTKSFN